MAHETRTRGPWRSEFSILTRMSLPVAAAQLGSMAMGLVDLIMVGEFNDTKDGQALAAVALGDLWIFGTLIVAMGIMMGLDPIVSQAHGARDGRKAGLALQHGIVLGGMLSIPLMALWLFAEPALVALQQDPEIAARSREYCDMQVFSACPFLIFVAFRQYLQGRGMMSVALWIVLIANIFNALVNWVLIFGKLGFPELGIEGAGIATGLTRLFMMAALIAWVVWFRLHRGAWVPWSRESFQLPGLRNVLAHGVPIGIQFALEVWAFTASGLMAGMLGKLADDPDGTILASHTITLKMASFSFMVPLGISIAAATRVGNLIGAKDPLGAQRAAWTAMVMGGGVMLFFAAIFVVWREQLPFIFSEKPEVVAMSAAILPIAAAFQLFDGTQAVGAGILRGMGTTKPGAIANFIGFWPLGLPLAAWLTFGRDWGLPGIWWGLCVGLGVVAVLIVGWIALRGPGRMSLRDPRHS